MPVYGAAKPVSVTSVAATTAQGAKVLKVSGKGVAQGSGRSAYDSIGSALSLGSTSRKLPTCAPRQVDNCVLNATARGVDLRYTGLGSIPGDKSSTGIGWFGFSTWGNWTTMASGGGQVEFEIDTDADGTADYVVAYIPSQTDQPMAVVFDSDGAFAGYPVNFFDADTGTNAYDTNVATLPFLLSDLGVPNGAASFPIRYRTVSYSGFYGNPDTALVDSTGWVSADLAKPALKVADPLFADRNGTSVPYSVNASSAAAKTGSGAAKVGSTETKAAAATSTQALILHLHGRADQRAQVVTVR